MPSVMPSVKRVELLLRRGLAFYKQSEEIWTAEEFDKIRKYCGDKARGGTLSTDSTNSKYIFDDDSGQESAAAFMFNWSKWANKYLDQCEKVCYEDIFPKQPLSTIYD